MKKFLAVILVLTMALSLIGCGGGTASKKQAIVGTWKAVDTENETEYGLGIEFTKDGKLRYGLTEDVLNNIIESNGSEGDVDDAMQGLDMLMSIEYKIKSDTEMEITASAMFGLAKETTTVEYSLNGDTLVFDGATFTRV
ncbi:MAG: hypothetical protein IJF80_05195 [Clostridia bacterium]|nr:hypothetical protein [Clostridia bacterium]